MGCCQRYPGDGNTNARPCTEVRCRPPRQEDNKKKLPLLAQLNVEADAIATQYQRDHGHHQTVVPLTERAGVHLHLPSRTIILHYENALRFHITAAPLQTFMQQKYSWTSVVFSYINWGAHGSYFRKHLSKRTHLIKFVHGILPVNATIHRKDPIRNRCPVCKNCRETWTHVMRCTAAGRGEGRSTTLSAIDSTCVDWNTDPLVRQIVRTAISGWLDQTDPRDPNSY